MSKHDAVLVAGGGIGGLTTAIALTKRGIPVRVFEQTVELREVGAGVQISPNGMKVLNALGLGDEVADIGCRTERKTIRLGLTGEMYDQYFDGAASREKYGSYYYTIHRADLFDILLRAVRAIGPELLQLGRKVVGFEHEAEAVTIRFQDGSDATGAGLIAADGVHSTIRNQMFGADRPKPTGIMAWRGTAPMTSLPEHIRNASTRNWNWIGPYGHIVSYPLRRGELMNVASYIERSDSLVESWSQTGTHEEYLNDFKGWHEDIRTMIRHISQPFKWALMLRDPLPHWSRGRVTLLGDAAHPTLPFMAQGANMTIEDAFVIARCLSAHTGDVRSAFAAYEAARKDRGETMVRRSSDNTLRYHNPLMADPDEGRRYVEKEFARDRVIQNNDWLYGYDATTAAI